jgi:hypothetical protein
VRMHVPIYVAQTLSWPTAPSRISQPFRNPKD